MAAQRRSETRSAQGNFHPLRCRFCKAFTTNVNRRDAWDLLKRHVRIAHPEQAKAIAAYCGNPRERVRNMEENNE